MRPQEKKLMCDIISTVANAVATDTIPEAEDYLQEKYDDNNAEIIDHTLNVLTNIYNKQTKLFKAIGVKKK